MLQWKTGCSGFYYTDWKNSFYPEGLPQRKWFEYYCRHFNSVELNVTFYRFPKLEFLQSWHDRSPDNFIFSVKAPRLITHYKRFKDAQRLLHDFYNCVSEGLQEKTGPLLFQFPSTFIYDPDTLDQVVDLLDKSFTNVLEFRHMSWWDEKVYRILSENNITFCGMSHPTLPDDVITTTDTIYYRLHGVPELYYSPYGTVMLQQLVDKIAMMDNIKNAYLYFNNTAGGAAVSNAKQVQEYSQVLTVNR